MAGSGKSRRGFASMDASRQREIASKGGRAAHEKGTAHEWSSDEARVAGQKGGIAGSRDRAHMARSQGTGPGASGDRELSRAVGRDASSNDRTSDVTGTADASDTLDINNGADTRSARRSDGR